MIGLIYNVRVEHVNYNKCQIFKRKSLLKIHANFFSSLKQGMYLQYIANFFGSQKCKVG